MKVSVQGQQHADLVLARVFAGEWQQLLEALDALDFVGSHVLAEGAARDAIARAVSRELMTRGWWPWSPIEGQVTVDTDESQGSYSLRRGTVFAAIDFGRMNDVYADLFRFQAADRACEAEVGVLVVASEQTARTFGAPATNFDDVQRLSEHRFGGSRCRLRW